MMSDGTINIDEEAKSMKEGMEEMPRLLKNSAGKISCCIFRVPQSLVEVNKEAYHPRIVSIGPYHHGETDLKMIEEHKWRFLKEFFARTGSTLEDYLRIVASMEVEIRESYSEKIDYNSSDLVKMMVLDGFFIIELFRKVGEVVKISEEDPIFTMAWVLPFLMRDLIRLENQLPFFVLQRLFDEFKTSGDRLSLQMLTLKFFNYILVRPKKVLDGYKHLEGKHILDFFRNSFIKNNELYSHNIMIKKTGKKISVPSPFLKVIPSATKLNILGVKFKSNPSSDTFLDIKFRKGRLEIPHITLDDFIASLLINCIAFEQCYLHCSKDITAYVTFMGCLINTPNDSSFLCDNKIIEKYLGTDDEIALFFNKIGKDVAFDIKNNYLSRVFVDVNEYCMNGLRVEWAGFKYTYFATPWSFISALAGFVLLVCTFVQAYFAPYAYFRPPK